MGHAERVPVRRLREFRTLGKKDAGIAHRHGTRGPVKFQDMREAVEFSGRLRPDPEPCALVGQGAALCEGNPERRRCGTQPKRAGRHVRRRRQSGRIFPEAGVGHGIPPPAPVGAAAYDRPERGRMKGRVVEEGMEHASRQTEARHPL